MRSIQTEDNGIRKQVNYTDVTVDKVYTADYQKEGTKTAQLRQEVVTKTSYPSKKVENNKSDNVFSSEDFSFDSSDYTNTEKRVAWILVPPSVSVDDVLSRIPKEATLWRELSNQPILTEDQAYAIENPDLELSLDDIANRQVVRYPDNHEQAGKIVLDPNGKPQYRAVFFSKEEKEDVDNRTENANEFYASEEIKKEMETSGFSVVQGQSLMDE